MDGNIRTKQNAEENIAKAASLKNCLIYLLKDAKDAELGWCALHLKIAISELDNVMTEKAGVMTEKAGV